MFNATFFGVYSPKASVQTVFVCVKLGRALPQLPASLLYSPEELEVLQAAFKKTSAHKDLASYLGRSKQARRKVGRLPGQKG
jgi:hypothetical protein